MKTQCVTWLCMQLVSVYCTFSTNIIKSCGRANKSGQMYKNLFTQGLKDKQATRNANFQDV